MLFGNSWPVRRRNHGRFNSSILIGGSIHLSVEIYDIAEGKWISSPPMPTPRHGEVVATVGNTMYVIGGANRPSHDGGISTVEGLDFS
jgi:N-acetylneuraminic acid mutarotase